MRQLIRLLPVIAAILGLSGCGSSRPIMYYGVQMPAIPSPRTHTYPVDVVVARVTGTDLLESSPIVYKTRHNQIGTYQYHRWTEAPVDMVQAKLVRLLKTSGEYQSVGASGNTSGDLVVRGTLYDFAEVDGDAITGMVSMEFELYNRKASKILWSHFYSQTEPADGKEITAVVQALDRNLDRGLKEVVSSLGRYFAANPPARTSLAQHPEEVR